jgi:hypothetical protein
MNVYAVITVDMVRWSFPIEGFLALLDDITTATIVTLLKQAYCVQFL